MSRDRVQSTGEFLSQEARRAVREVRQRLFEEAWFGRVVTGQPRVLGQEIDSNRSLSKSFDELWGRASHAAEPQRPEREMER